MPRWWCQPQHANKGLQCRRLETSKSWHARIQKFSKSPEANASSANSSARLSGEALPHSHTSVPSAGGASAGTIAVRGQSPLGKSEEELRHLAWRWRFTRRWCQERMNPRGEPGKREAMYTAVLAGRVSHAGVLGSCDSIDTSMFDKSFNTLTESMLFTGTSDAATMAARHSIRDAAR